MSLRGYWLGRRCPFAFIRLPHHKTMTTDKIQTYGLALETVEQDGDTYRLTSSPQITYHDDEGRVSVQGYGSLELKDEYGSTVLTPSNSGGRRVLQSTGDADKAEEMQRVRKRIRALLGYAGANFTRIRN